MSGPLLNSQLPRRVSRCSGQSSVQHASRIEKPRSHQNSPRTLERRKTTTENKLYATLDDHFRMMFGVSPDEVPDERPQPSRPVSWHPSSSHLPGARPVHYVEPVRQDSWLQQPSPSSRQSNHGSDFYSLSTRNSLYEAMANAPDCPAACSLQRGSQRSEQHWQPSPHQRFDHAHAALNTPVSEPLPWYLEQWAQKNQAQVMMNRHTRSPDGLPIQGDAGAEAGEEEEGERLVALGLYDVPESSPTWDTTAGGMGKGLKLEETWQPPAHDSDGEEGDGDDASSEASVEEPSPPLPPTHHPSPYMRMSGPVKSQHAGIIEGQSFFLEGDETVSKEWWFQQLQQPTMPVRDAGLGYGWL